MAKPKKKSGKSSKSTKKPAPKAKTPAPKAKKSASARRPARAKSGISLDDVKRMPKAPGDYEEVADQFADALVATGFRAPVSGSKMRSLARRGQKLGQKARALELKFIEADRARMAAESAGYKALLSNWRAVQARLPDQPTLADAFQFMTDWMSVNSKAADDASPPAAPGG